MRIARADHFVLTVRDVDATVEWYRKVLGMQPVVFGDGRRALAFGNQKFNLHQAGRDDPDTPTGSGFWHWLLLGLPADSTSLPAGAGSDCGTQLPTGTFHLRNDFGQAAYGGAHPPAGDPEHRYLFAIHALDTEDLGLEPDSPTGCAGFVLTAHTIARGVLRPTFRRD